MVERERWYARLFCDGTGCLTSTGQEVLKDLSRFCKVDEPIPDGANGELMARLAGRRDVWLWLQSMLKLNTTPTINKQDF